MRDRTGFTLIELIMVMVIIAVLAGTGAFCMVFLAESAIFVPNKLGVEMASRDLMDSMIEGTPGAKGLRFTSSILAANATNVRFVNADSQVVEFMFNNTAKRITISINNGTQANIPAYLSTGMYIEQYNATPVFSYVDSGEMTTATPSLVRRVQIQARLRSGSGSMVDWQSGLPCVSSIAVKKFQ